MKIFIIGASGLVGSHCLRYFRKREWEVIGTHLNYSTPETVYFNPVKELFTEDFNLSFFNPDVIIHCGALTNVDYCEYNVAESEVSTIVTTKNIVNYCKKANAKIVYISTDYVFDGMQGPYTEDAVTCPINIYGRHKLRAERIVKTLPQYIIARITNVYGEEVRAKNFIARLIFMLKQNIENELDLPIDQFATPVYGGDIARMLFHLIEDGKNGIYNLSSSDYYDRYHLALKVKSYFPENSLLKINYTSTERLKQTAQRPLRGGLLNIKFVQEYPTFEFTNIDSFIQGVLQL